MKLLLKYIVNLWLFLFLELERKLDSHSSKPMLLQNGKKKQKDNGSKELKRLQSSINYEVRSKKTKDSDVQVTHPK